MVVTFLMGTKRIYDFIDHNPAVEMRTVDYVNHPVIVAQIQVGVLTLYFSRFYGAGSI